MNAVITVRIFTEKLEEMMVSVRWILDLEGDVKAVASVLDEKSNVFKTPVKAVKES